MYVVSVNFIPFEIPVIAQSEHIDTHIPENVQVIKNQLNDFLISLNLLSSPAFFILMYKNVPNLDYEKRKKLLNIFLFKIILKLSLPITMNILQKKYMTQDLQKKKKVSYFNIFMELISLYQIILLTKMN